MHCSEIPNVENIKISLEEDIENIFIIIMLKEYTMYMENVERISTSLRNGIRFTEKKTQFTCMDISLVF